MKVTDLKLEQEVIINGFRYKYKGINKVKLSGYKVQKIVFKSLENGPDKYFDITLGHKDIKTLKIELPTK
ncbi:hypothetical protein C1637_09780 [Chryseobacterium lactis]|uniref:Uncharacterized protein n=1 Tax=Chryseobacterium lactis TaxID=1241981 RepID=A0A3G6RBZ7_CHRLC|nr:hypothetical protein [Chryseobacterium lactis]AZA82200.1 hypothetical protein EG342_09920 [Chryseobacterium lactis]AZB02581.1 hypothetical protein EG341_00775 [Chryseobacterium lactis]PNW14124.1 hypothetical protein C1637_09780 [Chryseobacterium lactis]